MTEALARISSVEGFKGLWKGIASVILGAGPAHALYFGAYEFVKDQTGGNRDGLQLVSTSVAGASATIVSDAFMNPFDGTFNRADLVIKQRMQLQGNNYTSVLNCARELYKNEGLRTFFVSYPTTLTMTVPFTAIQFATYEWAKKLLNPSDSYSPLTHVVAGGCAGATAAALTTPLDVAKTLLQTRGCSSDPIIRDAKGMGQAFKIIHQREGLRGFFRGLTPRIFTHMPSNALCWLVRFMKLTFSHTKVSASCSRAKISSSNSQVLLLGILTVSCPKLLYRCDMRQIVITNSTDWTQFYEEEKPLYLVTSQELVDHQRDQTREALRMMSISAHNQGNTDRRQPKVTIRDMRQIATLTTKSPVRLKRFR